MDKFNLQISRDELNVIINHVAQGKYFEVAPTLHSIKDQVNAQVKEELERQEKERQAQAVKEKHKDPLPIPEISSAHPPGMRNNNA